MIRITACIETAHKLAEEHVRRQGPVGPDVAAWRVHGESWVAKGSKRWDGQRWVPEAWTATEYRCIAAYAAAALGYSSEQEKPRKYTAPPEERGLWGGGNVWDTEPVDVGHAA